MMAMSRPEPAPQEAMLRFSVHSLPAPEAAQAQRTRMGRLKMLLVLAVCAAPVVASYLSYNLLRPDGRSNYGSLILPPHAMPSEAALRLTGVDGQVLKPAALKGQWLLVVVAGGACDARCEQQLYWQRQLRETLGKDKDRLDRVWLIPDQAPVRAAILPGPDAHLYLVDPRGDWMMRFPADADPTRIKKDLARLMKANESWDLPGR